MEVLRRLTAVNVAKNLCELSGRSPKPRYFYGEFGAVANKLCEKGCGASYDIILSSETLYSTDSYRSLLLAIKQVMPKVLQASLNSCLWCSSGLRNLGIGADNCTLDVLKSRCSGHQKGLLF